MSYIKCSIHSKTLHIHDFPSLENLVNQNTYLIKRMTACHPINYIKGNPISVRCRTSMIKFISLSPTAHLLNVMEMISEQNKLRNLILLYHN